MLNRSDGQGCTSVPRHSPRLRRSRIGRGQTAVEFAMVSVLALVVMIVGLQFALIGQAALALSQGASAIARYAAVYEPQGQVSASYSGNPTVAMQALLSSTLGTNSWGDLTVTISSVKGGTPSTTTTTPLASTDRAVVTLSYNAASKIFLPSSTLLGITFPTALSASDQELYE
jgi:Flp pilus assembly protein TadG